MRFGIFYEHQLPRPWDGDAEERLLQDALDQVELADKLGYDAVWEVEHHFLEEYSHSSASEVFLAACSQRTQNIRLGFGIVATPPGYQHPARVAEKVSTLDLVSRGRVEFGSGETSSGAELGGFGVDRETKRQQWDEALDVVTRMFVEEPFAGYEGRFLTMPSRNVIRVGRAHRGPHARVEHVDAVAVGLEEARLLAGELLVERRARHAGLAHDVGHRGGDVALLGHHPRHRVEQPRALAVAGRPEAPADVGMLGDQGPAARHDGGAYSSSTIPYLSLPRARKGLTAWT